MQAVVVREDGQSTVVVFDATSVQVCSVHDLGEPPVVAFDRLVAARSVVAALVGASGPVVAQVTGHVFPERFEAGTLDRFGVGATVRVNTELAAAHAGDREAAGRLLALIDELSGGIGW